jgi:hypothetical protein
MASRLAIARGLAIDESQLRAWERAGALPLIDEVGEARYMALARLIAAGRGAGVTLDQVRRALGVVRAEELSAC